MKTLTHRLTAIAPLWISLAALALFAPGARAAEVTFDLPSSIECRDITSPEFAATHPDMKIVEAKLRISARLVAGNASEINEFFYSFRTEAHMRIRDYTPNTTLESAVAEDKIEITNNAETSKADAADAFLVPHPFSIGGSHNQSTKKAETTKFHQLAARDVVLASGTTDREHGVFFRLRPSRTMALEGGKEFSLTVSVPRTWRGDLVTISCAARGMKKSLISSSIADVGISQAEVGMYLAGDRQAAATAEQFRTAQESYLELLAKQPAKDNVIQTISTQTAHLFKNQKVLQQERALVAAKQTVDDLRLRIERLTH